jgi:hypothetical protein
MEGMGEKEKEGRGKRKIKRKERNENGRFRVTSGLNSISVDFKPGRGGFYFLRVQ